MRKSKKIVSEIEKKNFTEILKKYGILTAIIIGLYKLIKKCWYWIILPTLGFYSLKNILIANSINEIDTKAIIAGWIFCLVILYKIFIFLFEPK